MSRLRFDAGSLSLNLLATVGRRFGTPVERLMSLERLHAWLTGVGLASAAGLGEAELARIRSFREDLDRLIRAVLTGQRVDPAAVSSINEAAAIGTRLRLRITNTHDRVELEPPDGSPLEVVLALIARDAIRLLTSPARGDLRECEAPDCRMLYLARSESERRWCSSRHCGNRSRVAAHRARRQTASRPPKTNEAP